MACEFGNWGVAELLLQRGANPAFRRQLYGRTCLQIAAYNNHANVVKGMLHCGCVPFSGTVVCVGSERGLTSSNRHSYACEVCVCVRAHVSPCLRPFFFKTNNVRSSDIDATDNHGSSALHLAIRDGEHKFLFHASVCWMAPVDQPLAIGRPRRALSSCLH